MRGILAGLSSLRRASSLLLLRFVIVAPREDAWLSAFWENELQEGLCTLMDGVVKER